MTTSHGLILLRIPELAQRLGLSRSKIYELIDRGEIRCIHVDRSVRVPMEEVDRWLAGKMREAYDGE